MNQHGKTATSTRKTAASSRGKGASSNNQQLLQLQSAVNNIRTPVIMINRDFEITYLNKATQALLDKYESTFKSVWPSFSADPEKLMGACIDMFHKNPEHQRRLLSDPGNLPYETDIQIKDLIFNLQVSAVTNAKGEYTGNTLEWSDVTEVRKQENNVARLQAAVDQAQTALIMIDRDFMITYANEATLAILKEHEATFQSVWPSFKADPEQVLGTCVDTFHKNPAHQRQLLSSPNNLPYTTTIEIADLKFELNVNAIRDIQGNYIGNTLEWSDVTAQRKQENNVARLQAAVDQAQTALIMIDRDFMITYANEATLAILKEHEATFQSVWPSFKADPEQVLGTCVDTFHKNPAHQRQLLSNPNNLPYTTTIEIADLKFELNVNAIRDTQGNYIGNTLEWSDVTAQRKQENNVARLQAAVDQAQTAMIMINRDFEITYANEATLAILKKHETTFQSVWPNFKADPEHVLGTCVDTFHKNPAHQRQLLSTPNNLPYSTTIEIADLKFELNVNAMLDVQGNYIGNTLEWSDVTDLRKQQDDVARLQAAVNQAQTAMIMIDRDFMITYANENTLSLLKKHEATLQSVWPSFRADPEKLIGTCVDTFHKNPQHQRNLLATPNNLPYSTIIEIADLKFELNVNAILDLEGNYIGNTLEWADVTAQSNAEEQIEQLINSAVEGKLDSRIDTASYSDFLEVAGNGINRLLDAVVNPIKACTEIMENVADGDLTQDMEGEYHGQFEVLANAINSSVSNLRNMVGDIIESSDNVSSSAKEIADGNTDLSQRTEEQASSLEETSSSMEQLSGTITTNAKSAQEANQLAVSAMGQAEKGGEVVSTAVNAMAEINHASKKIADIIGVIDEIAFQTNLLALNAAVEAARAGDLGRGFAVVAAEVRNLAQRSAGAAKEIKGLINDSVEKVNEGSRLVDDSGTTLKDIIEAVREVTQIIGNIDTASQEQAAGVNQVNQAIGQMDEMTQQNAALVEQAAAASESLQEQSANLVELIGFFKIDETEPRAKPAAKGSSRVVKLEAQPRQARMKKVEPHSDEWEEF